MCPTNRIIYFIPKAESRYVKKLLLLAVGDGKPRKAEACSTEYNIFTQVELVINDKETSIIVMDRKEITSLKLRRYVKHSYLFINGKHIRLCRVSNKGFINDCITIHYVCQ